MCLLISYFFSESSTMLSKYSSVLPNKKRFSFLLFIFSCILLSFITYISIIISHLSLSFSLSLSLCFLLFSYQFLRHNSSLISLFFSLTSLRVLHFFYFCLSFFIIIFILCNTYITSLPWSSTINLSAIRMPRPSLSVNAIVVASFTLHLASHL